MNTLYDRIGGEQAFDKLASEFYKGVAEDPLLRPMYPEEDLGPAERRLRMFLEQYWGGPTDYSDQRGHPRLRMRHVGFPIDATARDHWLMHMREALDEQQLPPEQDQVLWQYLQGAAFAMQNVADEPPPGTVFNAEPAS